jgi:hypothetical protein
MFPSLLSYDSLVLSNGTPASRFRCRLRPQAAPPNALRSSAKLFGSAVIGLS